MLARLAYLACDVVDLEHYRRSSDSAAQAHHFHSQAAIPRRRRLRLHPELHVRPCWLAASPRWPAQKAERAAGFSRQLQPAEIVIAKFAQRRPNQRHPFATEGLIECPQLLGGIGWLHDHELLGIEA